MPASGPAEVLQFETAMFDSPLYDPNAKWRADPVSEAQIRTLGLTASTAAAMTKGQAAELISSSALPRDNEIEFLKFFGVALAEGATQQDGYCEIEKIIADAANRKKWEDRPATKRERVIIEYMEGFDAAQSATSKDAANKLKTYPKSTSSQAKYSACLEWLEGWRKVESAFEIREIHIADHYDSLARDPEGRGLKRVSQTLVRQAIDLLETEHGTTLEALEQDHWFHLRVAHTIRRLDSDTASQLSVSNIEFFCPWENEQKG
jgi:hypothetical protein